MTDGSVTEDRPAVGASDRRWCIVSLSAAAPLALRALISYGIKCRGARRTNHLNGAARAAALNERKLRVQSDNLIIATSRQGKK